MVRPVRQRVAASASNISHSPVAPGCRTSLAAGAAVKRCQQSGIALSQKLSRHSLGLHECCLRLLLLRWQAGHHGVRCLAQMAMQLLQQLQACSECIFCSRSRAVR